MPWERERYRHRFNVLLSTEAGTEDKCQILEEDFHIRMTQALESEMSLMCNLSKGVEEKGIEKRQ